jgi:hypothetical protein
MRALTIIKTPGAIEQYLLVVPSKEKLRFLQAARARKREKKNTKLKTSVGIFLEHQYHVGV